MFAWVLENGSTSTLPIKNRRVCYLCIRTSPTPKTFSFRTPIAILHFGDYDYYKLKRLPFDAYNT